MERQEKVIVLLPTLNEEKAIGSVIDKVPVNALQNIGIKTEIVIADGGSIDKTLEIANSKGAISRSHSGGKGKQVSQILDSIHVGLIPKPDYLFMLDSDDTYPPEYIVPMVKRLKLGLCDVITGYRIWNNKSMSGLHSIGNKALTIIANLLYLTKTKDLCTGYWGFNSKALESINITATGFDLEANLFSEVNRNHLRLMQIPVPYLPRTGQGHLKFTHGFIIAKKLITEKYK